MKVIITKQWETVFFEIGQGSEVPQRVELNIDYEKSIFTLNTEHEEAVSYKHKTASQAFLINKACLAAIKYAEEKLKV